MGQWAILAESEGDVAEAEHLYRRVIDGCEEVRNIVDMLHESVQSDITKE